MNQDLPAIEDFNCPLLVKRKREHSTEHSGKLLFLSPLYSHFLLILISI